jgi:hypothetical protein
VNLVKRKAVRRAILAVGLLGIAFVLAGHVQAKSLVEGGGWFDGSIPETSVEITAAGVNTIVHLSGGGGLIGGTFEGTWIHDEWDVIHSSGIVTLHGWNTMDVTLNGGAAGTVLIRYEGIANSATGEFSGQFVIVSGTGALATLHGHGTVWVDATGAGGYRVSYSLDA